MIQRKPYTKEEIAIINSVMKSDSFKDRTIDQKIALIKRDIFSKTGNKRANHSLTQKWYYMCDKEKNKKKTPTKVDDKKEIDIVLDLKPITTVVVEDSKKDIFSILKDLNSLDKNEIKLVASYLEYLQNN